MAYEYVRTQYIDIGGTVYWNNLGTRSFTYRFALAEQYDPEANRTRLSLSAAQLSVNVSQHAAVYGKLLLNGSVAAHFRGASVTSVPGSFVGFGSGGSVTVEHDALGAAPNVSLSFAKADGAPAGLGSNFGFTPESGVVVGFSVGTKRSVPITTHPRASSIASCPASVETGAELVLNVTRHSQSFRHKAVFLVGEDVLGVSEAFDTTLRFTVPRSWFANYPALSVLDAAVCVQTYSDEACVTAVGSAASAPLSVRADAGMKPAVSAGWAVLSALNGGAVEGLNGYILGYSRAQALFDPTKIDFTASPGASIASYALACQGETVSASPYRTGVLTALSVEVLCTVTDTRGRSAGERFTLSVMDYAPPTLGGVSICRSDEDGAPAADGGHCAVKADAVFSSLGGQNSCALRCAIMPAGGAYGAESRLQSGVRSVFDSISPDRSYTVRLTAEDALGNTAVFYRSIPTRRWAMKFRSNGRGVAFGKAAEHDDCFEVGADWSVKLGAPLGVTSGGTGADSAAAARANLGLKGASTLEPGELLSLVYPVGSLYLSVNSTNPGTLFGGTWVQIEDTFLLAAGQTYTAGATGGEAAHTLTVDEMPSHNHTVARGTGTGSVEWGLVRYGSQNSSADGTRIAQTGGGQPHNNMPPYLAVYIWKRTA